MFSGHGRELARVTNENELGFLIICQQIRKKPSVSEFRLNHNFFHAVRNHGSLIDNIHFGAVRIGSAEGKVYDQLQPLPLQRILVLDLFGIRIESPETINLTMNCLSLMPRDISQNLCGTTRGSKKSIAYLSCLHETDEFPN